MKYKILPLIGFFYLLMVGDGTAQESVSLPSLPAVLRNISAMNFCGEQIPIETQAVRERIEKELMISLWDRPQAVLWLKRSTRYLPIIEKILQKYKLPDDLKYVAIAESALRPHVGSPKGAIGFWQFMADTGRKYGLTINQFNDDRRNVFLATHAAAKYFKDLKDKLKTWSLAAAAFNMGEQGLLAEIMEQDVQDYWRLYLPLETQRYLPRILSVKMIMTTPAKFGFVLTATDYYPPLRFKQVTIDNFQETPLRLIAKAANTDFKTIKDLNPQIRGHYLSAGRYALLIPPQAPYDFEARLKKRVKRYQALRQERVYIVKKGDNLSNIADRFNVPLAALLIWNRLDIKQPIHPGKKLIIYAPQPQDSIRQVGIEKPNKEGQKRSPSKKEVISP